MYQGCRGVSLLSSFLLIFFMTILTFSPVVGIRHYSDSSLWNTQKCTPRSVNKLKTLHFGGIFPMEGSWAGGQSCRPAVDMALEDVNCRKDILPGYTLKMESNNSKCLPGLGMNVMYELLYQEPTKLMLLGPGCSEVSTFVGQAARMWNLVVLSWGSSSPALSNRKRFPTFFRTHPSATLHNPTRVKLFKKFKWTKIATIQETQEVFTSTIEDLEERVKDAEIEIAVRTNFLTDPSNAVRNLKRQDARIIVGVFYEDKARRVFCEVYKAKLYGPKHVWFIIGWFADDWYARPDPAINCTAEQMKEAVQGHFATEGLMLNQDNITTVSGMTSAEFMTKVTTRIGENHKNVSVLQLHGYVETPLAYDAVWALALALNKTQHRLEKKGKSLENFNYSNSEIMEELYGAMNSTDFTGVSGRVRFNAAGDRIAWTQIEQMWDGNYTKIGFYDFSSDNLTWFGIEKWMDGKVPQDRTIIVSKTRVVSAVLYITMCLLASAGVVAGTILLVFNTKYHYRRFIKMSQPHVNSLMLIGCIVCLSCIFLQGLDGRYISESTFGSLCQVRAWVLSMGFTLAYAPMFSKVWVIYRISTRRKTAMRPLRVWEMYIVVSIFLLIDFIVLVTWHVLDPLKRDLESFPHEKPRDGDGDIEIKPQLEHCTSEHFNIWLGVIFGHKGILLLFGILLAYETRNVKLKQINDSRFVGMSIYNVVVLCIITAPVTLIIRSHQDASFAFVAVAILLSCFLSMGLVFVPKILDVYHNPESGAERAALNDSNGSRQDEERHQRLLQENEDLKNEISQRETKVAELNRRLHLKTEQRVDLQSASPSLSVKALAATKTKHLADTTHASKSTTNSSLVPLSSSKSDVAASRTQSEDISMLGDINSDSALPTNSTSKSSKISAASDNYSESYC